MVFPKSGRRIRSGYRAHSGRRSRFEHGERKPKRFFTVEVLAGSKTWEKAFQLPLKEAQEKHYTVLYELESETNSEFEFQAHLVLFLAMYGVTKLPEDQYCFATAAGPVLVHALALPLALALAFSLALLLLLPWRITEAHRTTSSTA
ncbi:hypothetical protein PG991_011139 [Apiospora marii]|uniref:Uncharacterized protein n=1 Tax=Apiospora marii TaxID=335849 RepID=A0ABR1RDB1_9PEZI